MMLLLFCWVPPSLSDQPSTPVEGGCRRENESAQPQQAWLVHHQPQERGRPGGGLDMGEMGLAGSDDHLIPPHHFG